MVMEKTYKLGKTKGADGADIIHLIHPWLGEAVCKAEVADGGEGKVPQVNCQQCIGWMLYNGYLTK